MDPEKMTREEALEFLTEQYTRVSTWLGKYGEKISCPICGADADGHEQGALGIEDLADPRNREVRRYGFTLRFICVTCGHITAFDLRKVALTPPDNVPLPRRPEPRGPG